MQATKGMLEDIRIASPCTADWNAMTGDDRKRFCAQCKLHVFDLSAMTRAEATALLRGRGGRLCVRLFRREDGTVLTRDCPVGFRARMRRAWARAAALASALLVSVGCMRRGGEPAPGPAPAPATKPVEIMGDIAYPAPQMGGVPAPEPAPTLGELQVMPPVKPADPRELMGRVKLVPEPTDPKQR